MTLPIECRHDREWVVVGEIRDQGDCLNQDLACPECGKVVGERSTRTEAEVAR